jgi:hypothetical protein
MTDENAPRCAGCPGAEQFADENAGSQRQMVFYRY